MTGANIARAMQLSAPTVHEMIGRLERDGYITRGTDRSLSFTDSGREHAEHIVSRHRMIERFLTDVLGIPWDEVHEEAERIEHAMSPVLEERMFAAIGDAKTCPHGHPINTGSRIDGVPLADCEPGATIRILRFENEAEELLHYLHDRGVEPGLEGTFVAPGDDEITIELGGKEIALTHLGGRDGLGGRRPVAAAARRAARAARHLQRPLRALEAKLTHTSVPCAGARARAGVSRAMTRGPCRAGAVGPRHHAAALVGHGHAAAPLDTAATSATGPPPARRRHAARHW